MRNLWPSIEVIESNLLNSAATPLQFPDQEDSAADTQEGTENIEMPAFLRDKIRKRVASRMAQFDNQPKAGQIWRFDGEEKTAPLCVLLDQKQDEFRWQGWLVAPETDYATDKDVLLEPQDEPFDPLAGMVQTWNPLSVDIRKGNRVLALLAEYRLTAVREVAEEQFDTDSPARLGFVAPLKTRSGATVLTGTRISHPEDPRRRYQSIYRNAAQSIALKANQTQPGAKVIPLQSRKHIWRNVGWSLAASIMLAQAAIIANLLRGQPSESFNEHVNKASEYRSTLQPPANYAYLEVHFKPEAKAVDIRKLLIHLNATIVDGPGEFGQYRVRIKAGEEHDILKKIHASGLVDLVGDQ